MCSMSSAHLLQSLRNYRHTGCNVAERRSVVIVYHTRLIRPTKIPYSQPCCRTGNNNNIIIITDGFIQRTQLLFNLSKSQKCHTHM